MAIGFVYSGVLVATPDKTMTRASKPRVLSSRFGDGYEQRIVNGINNIAETYTVSFNNRDKDFIDEVVSFLDGKAGVSKFTFTIPDTNDTSRTGEKDVKVVCEDYSTNYQQDDFYSLTATFRRVYEA